MRILFLTQILPYPPNAGPRVKTWHVLRHLSQNGHEIHMVTFLREEENAYLHFVTEICTQVHTVKIKRKRVNDLLFGIKSILTGSPFLVERDNFPKMHREIQNLIQKNDFDVIHADQLSMAQFAWKAKKLIQKNKEKKSPFLIFDAHNATWTIMDRMKSHIPSLFRPLINLEKTKLRKYEGWLIDHFDHTLAVSEIDKEALLSDSNIDISEKISIIPIAVDTQLLTPVTTSPNSLQLLTIGTLHYPPNADGIRWFIKEVFPRVHKQIPNATLTVIGKNPPNDFFDLAKSSSPSIEITGYVDNLDPYLEKTAILIVPVLAGGGMRVRILEGFARQMAIITTTVGLEGIEAEPDRDVIVKDDPIEFSQAIINLLNDRKKLNQIANSGRKLVEQKYDWKVVFTKLDKVYEFVK